MGSQRKSLSETIFLNMGLMVIAAMVLVSFSGSLASAYVVPQDGDADGRIEILRRSGADGEGMDEALKYLEELDKYYAQVARPRGMYKVIVSPSNQLTYETNGNKDSQNTANDLLLEDDEESEEKEETVDPPQTKRHVDYVKRLEKFSNIQGADGRLSHMARPRFGKRSSPPHLRKMSRLLRTRIPIEMIYGGL